VIVPSGGQAGALFPATAVHARPCAASGFSYVLSLPKHTILARHRLDLQSRGRRVYDSGRESATQDGLRRGDRQVPSTVAHEAPSSAPQGGTDFPNIYGAPLLCSA